MTQYLLLGIVLVGCGTVGLVMGRGLGGFLKGTDADDRKAQILNDPDIQSCVRKEE